MTQNTKIWIFSPIYLDVVSFRLLMEKLDHQIRMLPAFSNSNVTYVAIDDTGGTDSEVSQLRNVPHIELVTCPFNLGHQRALVYGLRVFSSKMADEDIVITLDSDGEDQPEDLPRLIEPVLSDGSNLKKISLARRTKRNEPPFFKILYFLFKIGFRAFTGVLIRTGNFAVYRGWIAKNVLFHPHFDLSYSSALISLNLDTKFVPCVRGLRYAGRSRMGYLKLFIHGIRMFMPFLDRIAIRALIGFSILFGSAAFALIGIAISHFAFGHRVSNGVWMTLSILAMLFFIALGNFLLLFAIFSQSQGLALRRLDER